MPMRQLHGLRQIAFAVSPKSEGAGRGGDSTKVRRSDRTVQEGAYEPAFGFEGHCRGGRWAPQPLIGSPTVTYSARIASVRTSSSPTSRWEGSTRGEVADEEDEEEAEEHEDEERDRSEYGEAVTAKEAEALIFGNKDFTKGVHLG